MKLVVFPELLKAHVKSYTRKDGVFVQEHDDKRQAAAPKPSGGYSVAPFKHGGHQIKEPDGTHHVILHDKGVADRHAAALNHVAQTGKDSHMNEAIHAAAKKHMGLDSFDEVGSDREDFVDTGKTGLKRALHQAYDAGAGHSKGGAHRDAVVAEAGKHFGHFDTLDEAGHDGADFKEVSKGSLKHALKHAYASGAQKSAAKPAIKKPAGPKPGHMDVSTLSAGHHLFDKNGQKVDEVESVDKHPMGGFKVNTRAGYSHMVAKDGRNDHGLTNKAPGATKKPRVLVRPDQRK